MVYPSDTNMFPSSSRKIETSAWPFMVTDPCGCTVLVPDIAPGGSTGQQPDPNGYSHQAAPHYPLVFSSVSLHHARILLFLCIFQYFINYWFLLVVARASECCHLKSDLRRDISLVDCDTKQRPSQSCSALSQAWTHAGLLVISG